MKVTRFNPAFPSRMGLGNLVDDFFNRGVSDFFGADFILSRPSVNISETPEAYNIELAAPGLEKSDFDIKLEGETLVISAQKEAKSEEHKDNYTRREFNFSSFSRSFQLPKEVETQGIQASYEKGVLHLTLPKTQKEDIKPYKKIDVL